MTLESVYVEARVTLSTRYGLVGVGALSVLSLVQWARKFPHDGPEVLVFLMGVLPNATAAVAIPFVLLCIWADQKPDASYPAARRVFLVLAPATGVGLIAWEFLQLSSRALVFDVYDIGATVTGLCLGWVLFAWLTPAARANAP